MSDSDIELARRAIALLDLTDLTDDASAEGIDRLCERGGAARHGCSVRVARLRRASRSPRSSARRCVVATVVNFPSGDERPHAVRVVTERALDDGADEIDVVLPYRAWLAGDERRAADVIDGVRDAARERAHEGDPRDGRSPRRSPRSSVRRGSRSSTAPTSSRPRPARSRSQPRPRQRRPCSA